MTENFGSIPENQKQKIILVLLFLVPLTGMAVDLVAPSLPAIAHNLGTSTQIAKNVISIYLLGYALGNFFIGFVTDALGRQKILRLSLLSFVIVSLLPTLFQNINMILLSRFLQGLTLGAFAVVTRAIFSDILSVEKLIRLGTLIGAMWGLGPILGPVIGGYLQFYFGWQANFYFFTLFSFLGLIPVYKMIPETHFNRHALNFHNIGNNLKEVISNRLFMAIVILMGLVYSLIIFFNTAGPFLIQSVFHYSSISFGHLAFGLGLSFLFATLMCRYLLKKHAVETLFSFLIPVFFGLSVIGLLLSYFFPNSILLVAIISALMFAASGFIFPMSMGKGIGLFRHIAGTATAAMYLINVLITSLTAYLVSFVSMSSSIPMMWCYSFLLLLCLLTYLTIIHRP